MEAGLQFCGRRSYGDGQWWWEHNVVNGRNPTELSKSKWLKWVQLHFMSCIFCHKKGHSPESQRAEMGAPEPLLPLLLGADSCLTLCC